MSQRAARSACSNRLRHDQGFTLVEVMICTLILTTGLIAIAAMLAFTLQQQIGAREAARSMRLAQAKVDELMKLDFNTSPQLQVCGNIQTCLTTNFANHFEVSPDGLAGITLRWAVAAGPAADTRIVSIRVVNLRAQQQRELNLATIVRDW
jgi:Tfp pilus assembly protein PilV